jgi:very-short-patch-repair endonuclease
MTDAEKKLWRALRRDQIDGLHFRRQHAVGPYVLDFYCPALRLAIELDGGQHALRTAADARRTRRLNAKGIVVLRFWNNDVHGNLEGVLSEIARIVKNRKRQRATAFVALAMSEDLAREHSPSPERGGSDHGRWSGEGSCAGLRPPRGELELADLSLPGGGDGNRALDIVFGEVDR